MRSAPDSARFSHQKDAPREANLIGTGGQSARTRRSWFGTVGRFDTTNLQANMSFKLLLAYQLAWNRVAHDPPCAALLRKLGADGLEKLARSEFYAAPTVAPVDHCNTATAAYTLVGSPTVMLCPAFANLSTFEDARLLIHEALHFAGLGERPEDPHAPMSEEINVTVMVNCGL